MDIKLEKLEKNLVAKYQQCSIKDSSLKKLYKFSTTEISDALEGNNVMEYTIKPIDSNMRIIGRAFTIQLPLEDSALTNKAIGQAEPGDILVIHTNDSKNRAVWGDVKTLKAMKKGIGGIVVDGAIRDISRNRELHFPIFTKYVVPAASKHIGGGELQILVVCGKVEVNPRDIIMGDENGVVVIPKERLNEVIEKASEKLKSDEEKIKKILAE